MTKIRKLEEFNKELEPNNALSQLLTMSDEHLCYNIKENLKELDQYIRFAKNINMNTSNLEKDRDILAKASKICSEK